MLNFTKSKKENVPTYEQAKIISHDIKVNDVVKIVAFAGTGKTTTLLQFCRNRPQMKFLLVVFNKSVQEFCQKEFPSNTIVRTAHSMAFAHVGRRYNVIRKFEPNLKPMKIAEMQEEKANAGNSYKRAGLVKLTLERFLNSSDPHLTLRHVPAKDKHGVVITDNYRLAVLLDDAEKVWREMRLCSKTQRINMTQDGQLKEWQLQKPELCSYDVIMMDEGQDMNPAMFDILFNQNGAKMIVGDPYQQIYSFRGAVNALQSINATHTYYLTQSFRFGPEIAFVGQTILQNLLDVSTKTLVGGHVRDSIVNDLSQNMDGMQQAYLCRTNCHLYKLALQICKNGKYKNRRINFAGGIEKVGLDTVMDIFKLEQSNSGFGTPETLGMKSKFIAKFSSLNSLTKYAEYVEDLELLNKISMYKYSGRNTPNDISLLRSRCNSGFSYSDIVLSTIHKSKGLEWDWVILTDDILQEGLHEALSNMSEDLKGEFNLLYVAATRAKRKLTINTPILHALNYNREKLERLTSRLELTEKTLCIQCGSLCLDNARENTSPLITKVLTLPLSSDGYTFFGGYVCDKCAELTTFEMAFNPRRPLNTRVCVKDNERISRLTLISGTIDPKDQLNHEVENPHRPPIRWDAYRGNQLTS